MPPPAFALDKIRQHLTEISILSVFFTIVALSTRLLIAPPGLETTLLLICVSGPIVWCAFMGSIICFQFTCYFFIGEQKKTLYNYRQTHPTEIIIPILSALLLALMLGNAAPNIVADLTGNAVTLHLKWVIIAITFIYHCAGYFLIPVISKLIKLSRRKKK